MSKNNSTIMCLICHVRPVLKGQTLCKPCDKDKKPDETTLFYTESLEKTNELYTELKIKHQKLLDEYDKMNAEYSLKITEMTYKIDDLKEKYDTSKNMYENAMSDIKKWMAMPITSPRTIENEIKAKEEQILSITKDENPVKIPSRIDNLAAPKTKKIIKKKN